MQLSASQEGGGGSIHQQVCELLPLLRWLFSGWLFVTQPQALHVAEKLEFCWLMS